eukprot:3641570-Pyramimonas_sp.AAC.1
MVEAVHGALVEVPVQSQHRQLANGRRWQRLSRRITSDRPASVTINSHNETLTMRYYHCQTITLPLAQISIIILTTYCPTAEVVSLHWKWHDNVTTDV